MTSRVIVACVLLLLASPGALADAQGRNDRDRGPVETETVERTLPLGPGGELRLTTFSGRVTIVGGAGGDVVIKAVRRGTRERLDRVQLRVEQSGSVITVDANERLQDRRDDEGDVVETDFDIQVPSEIELDLRTFSAPVTVSGVTGSLEVDGFSSEVRLSGIAGPVQVKTFSGAVALEARGWTEGDDLDVTTFSGDVTVRLPDSARGDLVFEGFSGRLDSEIPVNLTSSSRRSLRGTLNGGGNSDFRFETFSGTVRIRR